MASARGEVSDGPVVSIISQYGVVFEYLLSWLGGGCVVQRWGESRLCGFCLGALFVTICLLLPIEVVMVTCHPDTYQHIKYNLN